MVKNCCVKGCSASWKPDVDISFFSFPFKNKDLLKEWLEIVPISNKISKYSQICSIHFDESQYDCFSGKRFLKKNAVPSIFPEDIAKIKEIVEEVEKLYPKCQSVVLESINNNNFHDHCYSKLEETFLVSSVLNETDKAIQVTPRTQNVGTQTSSRATEKEKELRYRIKSLQSKLRRKELKELKNMNEIATELRTVIKSINKSSAYVHQLNEMLIKYREREPKNTSTSRATLPS